MENTLNTLIKNCLTQNVINNAPNVIFVARFDHLTPMLNTQKDFSRLKSILFVGTFWFKLGLSSATEHA
jgi:hypothetical protein